MNEENKVLDQICQEMEIRCIHNMTSFNQLRKLTMKTSQTLRIKLMDESRYIYFKVINQSYILFIWFLQAIQYVILYL